MFKAVRHQAGQRGLRYRRPEVPYKCALEAIHTVQERTLEAIHKVAFCGPGPYWRSSR